MRIIARTVSSGMGEPLIELRQIAKDAAEASPDSMQLATYAEVCVHNGLIVCASVN